MDHPKKGSSGVGGMTKLVVNAFLEQRHFRQLPRLLADTWSGESGVHSLTAAVRLMEAHGVRVSPEEEKHLARLPEDRMIDSLVMRMPQQSREQFEHFFLQLSFIASTTTRLRSGLENGQTQIIEEALESAENVGVLPFLLKMATAQAGHEVKAYESEHDGWLANTDKKISPLLQSQQNSMTTQKALAQMKSQLGLTHNQANEKSKKVLLGMANVSDKALLTNMFTSWSEHVRREKRETEIEKEYREQIDAAYQKLFDYKESKKSNVKGILNRAVLANIEQLMSLVIGAFKEEVEIAKRRRESAEGVADMEGKVAKMSSAKASNAQRVVARMNAGSEDGLIGMCWAAWVRFCVEYKKNKELEEAVKASEQKIATFMKKQNDSAKSVLSRVTASSETGIVHSFFTAWAEMFLENKKATQFQEELNQKSAQLSSFSTNNKKNAMSATKRAALIVEQGYYVLVFGHWKRDAKIERVVRYGRETNLRRKEKLVEVKGLFKNFASELETNLKEGTPRVDGSRKSKNPSSPTKSVQ